VQSVLLAFLLDCAGIGCEIDVCSNCSEPGAPKYDVKLLLHIDDEASNSRAVALNFDVGSALASGMLHRIVGHLHSCVDELYTIFLANVESMKQ